MEMLNHGFCCQSWLVTRSVSLEIISLDTLASVYVPAISVDFIELLCSTVISFVKIVSGFNDRSCQLSPLSALKYYWHDGQLHYQLYVLPVSSVPLPQCLWLYSDHLSLQPHISVYTAEMKMW